MKFPLLLALFLPLAQTTVFAQDGLAIDEREMFKDDIIKGVARRMRTGEARDSVGPLVNQEADPAFRQFLTQKLNAAGPLHPEIGVFLGQPYKGKTPGQVIELLRVQFYGRQGSALSAVDDGRNFGNSLQPRARAVAPAPVVASPAPVTPPAQVDARLRAESSRKALELYPAAAVANSPLTLKIREIAARMKAANDPALQSPSLPMIITQMASAELALDPMPGSR